MFVEGMYQKDPLKMRLLDVIENVFFLLENIK